MSSLDTQLFWKLSISDTQKVFPVRKLPAFDGYLVCLHFSPYSRLSSVFSCSDKICAFYCRKRATNQSRFFFNFEPTKKRFTTMLKQKTADVMSFHPLRLRLSADMSTCEIFCFQIVWLYSNSSAERFPSFFHLFFFLQTIHTGDFNVFFLFFFSFQYGIPNFHHRYAPLYLNIYHFRLKDD